MLLVLRHPLILALLLPLFAAGCGGSSSTEGAVGTAGTAGAELVRSDVLVYGAVDSDLESDQWQQVDALLQKFTFREKLIAEVRKSLSDEGVDYETEVKPALGPELAFAVLDVPEGATSGSSDVPFVAIHDPKDEARFEALLRAGDDPEDVPEFRKLDDGTYVIAETEAIIDQALVAEGGDSLADSERFDEAMASLPDDSLAKVYVNGDKLNQATSNLGGDSGLPSGGLERLTARFGKTLWISAAATAEDNGVRLEGASRGEDVKIELESYSSELVDEVPAGVVAYLSFNNLEQPLRELRNSLGDIVPEELNLDRQIAQFESALGVSIDRDLLPLFGGEAALYLQEASPIPAGTLVLTVDDEAEAMRTLDKLAAAATRIGGSAPRDVEIDGVEARELDLGQFSLFYAGFDGKLVLTSGRDGIEDLRADGPKLADDDGFSQAQEAAGAPDETVGFVYLDLEEGVPLALDLANLGDEDVPDDVRQNLEPLRSLFGYATSEDGGNRSEFALFLGIE